MRMASIKELRSDLGRILEWVLDGEELAVTKRGQTVARLLPVPRGKRKAGKMPDVATRLQKVFGGKVISGSPMFVMGITTVRVLKGTIAEKSSIYWCVLRVRRCERLELFSGFSDSMGCAKIKKCMLENWFSPNSLT